MYFYDMEQYQLIFVYNYNIDVVFWQIYMQMQLIVCRVVVCNLAPVGCRGWFEIWNDWTMFLCNAKANYFIAIKLLEREKNQ